MVQEPLWTTATGPVGRRGYGRKENERATGGAVQEIEQDTTSGGDE